MLFSAWHDDGHQKWEAMSAWCAEFEVLYQRSPRLWFDKICIDQSNVKADLACLPIFIAACESLLVVCGPSYVFRLWCVVELFVYDHMADGNDTRREPIVRTIGADAAEQALVRESWRHFDADDCDCFNAADKKRIFAVIAQLPGTPLWKAWINGFLVIAVYPPFPKNGER